MATYKHLSIPPEEFVFIEELMRRFNEQNNADLSPPKTVVMAAKRVLAEMDKAENESA